MAYQSPQCAEDDKLCQIVIQKVLARLGFVVVLAGNGQTVVDLFEQGAGSLRYPAATRELPVSTSRALTHLSVTSFSPRTLRWLLYVVSLSSALRTLQARARSILSSWCAHLAPPARGRQAGIAKARRRAAGAAH